MSQPIRILNVFMVLDRGGAETFAMNVYRHIDREKVQFDFLVHGDKVGSYEEEILRLGGRIYRLPDMKNLRAYKKAVKDFFDARPQYTLIHSHASELGLFIFKEAYKRGIPYRVCHAHSAPKGLNIKTPVRYWFKKRMAHYSNRFFACSQTAGIWQFGKHTAFRIIRNGISVDKFAFDEQVRLEVRKELGIANVPVIGHVGRFEKPKNHKYLIEVFAEIIRKTDAVLLLVGDGSLKAETEVLVNSKDLTDKVRFVGAQSNVAKYLNAMDCFVFPSLFEGLGIVLIEAQANGLRCYISDTIPEETDVTELNKRLSLHLPPVEWADAILSDRFSISDREEYADRVKGSGYGIEETAEQLQAFYLSCTRQEIR